MRAIIFVAFAVSCVVVQVYGQAPNEPRPGGLSPVETTQWDGVSKKVTDHLVQLDTEQGHQFKLIAIKNLQSQVVAGVRYVGTADFENGNGETITTEFSLVVQPWTGYEELEFTSAQQVFNNKKGKL